MRQRLLASSPILPASPLLLLSGLLLLLLTCLGWTLTIIALQAGADLRAVLAAAVVVLLVEHEAVRAPFGERLSLSGIVLLAALVLFGPGTAALVALIAGLVTAAGPGLRGQQLVLRRIAESGLRPLALLAADQASRAVPVVPGVPLAGIALCTTFFLVLWSGRLLLMVNRGTLVQLRRWRPESVLVTLAVELLPLPLAFLSAAVIRELDWHYALMSVGALVSSAVLLRRGTRSLRVQQERVAELDLLNRVSRALIRAELDVDALCDLVYQEAGKVVDTSWFHMGLFENDRFVLKVRVQGGERLPPLDVQLSGDGGITGWIKRTGLSLLVEDFAQDMEQLPARPTYSAETPPRSGIYIPLIAGTEVIGTISIQSALPSRFTTDDLRILALVADQAATAIAKAWAFSASSRRAQQLATISEVSRQITAILDLDQLLPAVVRRISASFGFYQVHLFLIDHVAEEVVMRASSSGLQGFWREHNLRLRIGDGLVGSVAKSGDPILLNNVHEDPRYIIDAEHTQSEMVVPLRVGREVTGVLDVQSDRLNAFDANDFFVIQTLADQIAIAIESANLYTSQQEEAWVLNALLQSAENFARAAQLQQMLDLTVRLPGLLMGAERATCLLWERERAGFVVAAAWGHGHERRTALMEQLFAPEDVPRVTEVWRSGELLELPDSAVHQYGPLPPGISGSLLLLPLTARGIVLGVLLLEHSRPDGRFSQRQITIASGIARQAAAAIEGAQLAIAEADRQRLEQELSVAREMQTSLLPSYLPQPEGWQVAAAWRSARQVGGDFYDVWHITPDQLGFVIADVSDKGVPAALFMTLSRSLVRASALDGSSPAAALDRANRWIARDSQSCMFVTTFYGLLDLSTGVLTYCNGGHNPPLLARAGGEVVQQLMPTGMALGVLDEPGMYAESQVTLAPGDLLVCYTDGVTEAINSEQEEFGMPRLTELVRYSQRSAITAEQVVEAILSDTAVHTEEQPAFDDLTLLVLRWLAD